MSLQRGINLRALAEKMGQCSGAEVRGICTEAGTSCAFPSATIFSYKLRYVRSSREETTRHTGRFRVRCGKGSFRMSFELRKLTDIFSQVLKKNQEGNTSVNKLFS